MRVEQRRPRHAHAVEGDPGVVEVVAGRLEAHVAREHAVRGHVHEEGVRAHALAVDGGVGQHHGLVRDVALADPVLLGARLWFCVFCFWLFLKIQLI